jgi:hypothetical protein
VHTPSSNVTRFAASPPTDNCPQPKEAQPPSQLDTRSKQHLDSSALWSDGPEVTLNWPFPYPILPPARGAHYGGISPAVGVTAAPFFFFGFQVPSSQVLSVCKAKVKVDAAAVLERLDPRAVAHAVQQLQTAVDESPTGTRSLRRACCPTALPPVLEVSKHRAGETQRTFVGFKTPVELLQF